MARKLSVFENISLDGYFTDILGDMGWAHEEHRDEEFAKFTASNAAGGGALLFGRVTYETMQGFWTTEQAHDAMPTVAKMMNELPKYVFSRTLKTADWNNTTLLHGEPAAEVVRLKNQDGGDITVLGSGTIVSQLVQARLVDNLSFILCPMILGGGRTLFSKLTERRALKLEKSRVFDNGKIFLSYAISERDAD